MVESTRAGGTEELLAGALLDWPTEETDAEDEATPLLAVEEEAALGTALKAARPTPELLQGFIGLRPGPRVLDEVELLAPSLSAAAP